MRMQRQKVPKWRGKEVAWDCTPRWLILIMGKSNPSYLFCFPFTQQIPAENQSFNSKAKHTFHFRLLQIHTWTPLHEDPLKVQTISSNKTGFTTCIAVVISSGSYLILNSETNTQTYSMSPLGYNYSLQFFSLYYSSLSTLPSHSPAWTYVYIHPDTRIFVCTRFTLVTILLFLQLLFERDFYILIAKIQ